MNKLTNIKHYKKEYVKAFYGRYGKETGLNPGLLWPRKEELKHIKMYEAAFCPKLEDLIAESESKKAEELRARKEFEDQVRNNLRKLPGEFKKFFEKINQKSEEKAEWLRQREAMIEEVREVLGYRAKPEDERFQKALEEKELEKVKAKKKEARKKRESSQLDQMMEASRLGLVVTKEASPYKKKSIDEEES